MRRSRAVTVSALLILTLSGAICSEDTPPLTAAQYFLLHQCWPWITDATARETARTAAQSMDNSAEPERFVLGASDVPSPFTPIDLGEGGSLMQPDAFFEAFVEQAARRSALRDAMMRGAYVNLFQTPGALERFGGDAVRPGDGLISSSALCFETERGARDAFTFLDSITKDDEDLRGVTRFDTDLGEQSLGYTARMTDGDHPVGQVAFRVNNVVSELDVLGDQATSTNLTPWAQMVERRLRL